MMSEQIILNKDDLAALLKELMPPHSRLPQYYIFPDDILAMLGNKPKESTVRGWKTNYGLRTVKIGAGTYVTEEDWAWWVKHNKDLMAAASRTRGQRLGGKNVQ